MQMIKSDYLYCSCQLNVHDHDRRYYTPVSCYNGRLLAMIDDEQNHKFLMNANFNLGHTGIQSEFLSMSCHIHSSSTSVCYLVNTFPSFQAEVNFDWHFLIP